MPIDINKKLSGILVPAFALRSKNDLGIGDTMAVTEAIDFCRNYDLGVLQLLPINESGGDNSPYNAISSFALDPVYIHMSYAAPAVVPGFNEELWQECSRFESHAASGKTIDYEQVKSIKNSLLTKAFSRFESGEIENFRELKKEFEEFQQKNIYWLPDYTVFRTIVAEKQGNTQWMDWEDNLKNPTAAKDWIAKDEKLSRMCRFYAYVQWVAHRQWTEVRAHGDKRQVELMGDIPFGISRYSADAWAHPHLFDLQWSGGAPPERFFQSDKFTAVWGQNWGIPLYDWQAHEKENYSWWRCRVEQITKYFHGFRLDHVLGFFRIYAFPWLPEQNDEFLELDAHQAASKTGGRLPGFRPESDDHKLSAQRNCESGEARLKMILQAAGDAFVVAEDLGVVPFYVRPLLKKLGIPGYAIPIFERSEVDRSLIPKDQLPPLSVATYATHDHEPLAVYYENLVKRWHSADGHEGWLELQRIMRFLELDENNPPEAFTNELTHAFFRTLLFSPCWLTMIMITDLLGTKQRFNLPGTSSCANWSERLEKSLDDYAHDRHYGEEFNYLRRLIDETRRTKLNAAHILN